MHYENLDINKQLWNNETMNEKWENISAHSENGRLHQVREL